MSTPKKRDVVAEMHAAIAALSDEDLKNMSNAEMENLCDKFSPYNYMVEGSKTGKKLLMSFTQMDQDYMKQYLVTGIIGYMYRALDEWNYPQDLGACIPVSEYLDDPSVIEPENWDSLTENQKKDNRENWERMQERVITKKFLDSMFQFNPNKHVRSIYRPNPNDKSRKIFDTKAARLAMFMQARSDAELKDRMRIYGEELKVAGSDSAGSAAEISDLEKRVTQIIPPMDTFHRLNRYISTHDVKLHEATQSLYGSKNCLECAVAPYKLVNNMEEAKRFIDKNQSTIPSEIIMVDMGMWNIRPKGDMLKEATHVTNKKTRIIDEMMIMKKQAKDLGGDMVKKRTIDAKKRNVEEEGKEAPGFRNWRENSSVLKEQGAIVITDKDMEDDDFVPDDSVRVNVMNYNARHNTVTKSHFLTKAEKPTYMQDALDAAESSTSGIIAKNTIAAAKAKAVATAAVSGPSSDSLLAEVTGSAKAQLQQQKVSTSESKN
jgi:hypothetical protein